MKDKDTELQTVLRELGRMKAKVVEQQEEIQKKTSLSSSQCFNSSLLCKQKLNLCFIKTVEFNFPSYVEMATSLFY